MTDAQTRPVLSTAQPEDYFQLLKPRVMSLVVFTAATGLVVAPGAVNPLVAAIAVLCIAVGAGAAGALNMALEGETDALMRRTRGRPVAAGRVRKNEAMAFGVILSLFSVMLLGMNANWLAAGLLALTIVYYAGFYTLLLKRRTPQNIVIGGAAGAFPPVIGWAAATGQAPWQAWLLFAIIFLWTPPHSWALALYSAGDYAKAGIPMMPVVRGARSTRLQILIYSLVFVPVAIAPAVVGLGGPVYLAVSVLGGLGFLGLALRLYRSRAGDEPDKVEAVGREAALYDVRAQAKPARDLFAFSILYLMALFAALLVEALSGMGA
ncbi:MAG: protoheme IX farnesyltransferase [Brevundimonas sp.]|uniref:Protoheme IX farnesyltransferase n=1 Tax=Brevundimonas albigilva TaxID=1312364 RepID=A0ABY4SP33_9CAUL|nr:MULTISPECIES: heme o synthase [Brevundimonas]MCV0413900.1 heme o synthase [Brevundimonas sp.]PZU55113.1 MAG: protoheme IX farnesyltransferase [Brevundimonas sp.]URI14440.1 heme o synthase [Brevundimonas albigilva]